MFQPAAIPVCNTKRIISRVVRTKEQVAGNEWNGFRGRGADGLHGLCVRTPRDWEWAPFRGKGNFAGETILGYPGGLRGTPRALMGSRQEGQGQRVGAGAGRTLPGGLSGWTLSQGVQAAPGGWCRQGRGAFPEPPETQAADTVILVRGDPFWTLVSGTAETQIRVVSKALGLRSSATAARGRACNP